MHLKLALKFKASVQC